MRLPLVENINWTTGLDPKTGKPTINEAMKPLSANGKTVEKIVPGLEGEKRQLVPAGLRDPSSGILFVAVNQWGDGAHLMGGRESCNISRATQYQGVDYSDVPDGRHDWPPQGDRRREQEGSLGRCRAPLPLFSGILATKGGVVFTGDQRGRLLAYDLEDRKRALEVPGPGPPSTLRQSLTS